MLTMIRNAVILLTTVSILLITGNSQASLLNESITEKRQISQNQMTDSLKWSIDYLNKLLYSGEWYLTNPLFKKPIKGVLNHAENDPLDSALVYIRKLINDSNVIYMIDRRPQDIHNRSEINGYISEEDIERGVDSIRKSFVDSLDISNIVVPDDFLEAELLKAPRVPDGNLDQLFGNKQNDLPSEFVTNLNKRISSVQLSGSLQISAMDSLRNQLFLSYRAAYNDSIQKCRRERIIFLYRSKYITEQTDRRIKAYKSQVEARNNVLLTVYNNKSIGRVNDSLKIALHYLVSHAGSDSLLISLSNLKDEKTDFWTANHPMKSIRMFLKNMQNDSLSVILQNNGKGKLKLVIDDIVKLTRFSESQSRTVTFGTTPSDTGLKKVKLNKIVYPSWTFFGNGSVGFTQTSLSSWSKGGESSLSLLFISKYCANYSKDKVKWENSAEFRYGVSQTKTRGFEKNDDKIELQSRFGYSAFKKWYYSAETNFRTQVARGYKFPDNQNPISAFMAPGYLTFSVGLDYKPNKNFSLFLAPITSKTTYVTDTVLINPSKYGLEQGKKKLWEPGIIIKANWHLNLSENISYDTKGEFFNNYTYTLRKFAFEWEQVFIMRVNRFVNARVMTQLVYDYNTKFPILDANNVEIGRKPKWQFKELFTIGLSYKF
jgi:hypothetical protein